MQIVNFCKRALLFFFLLCHAVKNIHNKKGNDKVCPKLTLSEPGKIQNIATA